jgi:catechol 1,2-dioxygenase
MMDRHPFRPAHIHFVVRHVGYNPLTTQIFDRDCKYLADDSVFAVKDELAVTFTPRDDDPQAKFGVQYNITLAPAS